MENINSENPIELSLTQKIAFVQSYQRTFNNWKSNYTTRVNDFVNDFVDNSEIIFIENEIDNIDNILLELDQALKDNYFEKDSIDLLDLNPIRDLYIDVRIESAIKSKSTYKKIKSFLEQRKKEIEVDIKPQTKDVPDNEQNKMYFKVGLLFAQRKIFSKVVIVNNFKTTKYHSENHIFDNINQLSKHLNLTRQYINDSFTGANSNHNIFNNSKQLKNIIEYCKENSITIDEDFLLKYSALIENRQ